MSELDEPMSIQLVIDPSGGKKGLNDLGKGVDNFEKNFDKSLKNMEANFKSFFKRLSSAWNDISFREGKFADNANHFKSNQNNSTSSPSNSSHAKSKNNSSYQNTTSKIADRRSEDQVRKHAIEMETRAQKQRDDQLKTQQQLLLSSKSMVTAISGLAMGLGVKSMLDFGHSMHRLENFLKSINADPVNTLTQRNFFKTRGVEEPEFWATQQKTSHDLTEYSLTGGNTLDDKTRTAYTTVKNFSKDLQVGLHNDKGGVNTLDQQFQAQIDGFIRFAKASERNGVDKNYIMSIGESLFGNRQFAQQVLSMSHEKRKDIERDYGEARGQARTDVKSFKNSEKLDKQYQKTLNDLNEAKAKLFTDLAPALSKLLEGLDGFIKNYGEIGLAAVALASLTGSIGGLYSTLKLFGFVPKATKAIAGSVWKGAEAVAGGAYKLAKGGVEYVAKHPVEVAGNGAKLGGRIVGAVPYLVYELTAGNVTDAKTTADDDVPFTDQKGNKTRAGRKRDIEQAVKGKVHQSFWSNDYYVETKDGTYVYLDDGFFTPIADIKRKIEEQKNNGKSSSFSLFPSAHADDVVPYYRKTGFGGTDLSKFRSRSKVSFDERNYIAKLLRDGYSRDGYQNFVADVSISNVNRESNFDIHAVGDNGRSYGLFQFDPPRQALFKKLFGHDIRQSTAEEQVKFHFWELKNNEKRAGDMLRRARNPMEAQIAFVKGYERSLNQDDDIQKNMDFMGTAYTMGRYSADNPPTNYAQLAQQAQIQKVRNEYNNQQSHTVNNGGNTQTNNVTMNIDAKGHNIDQIKEKLDQAIRFPSNRAFQNKSGVL